MRGYRLYLLDDRDHIRSAVDLECEDDAQAIHEAKTSLNAPMELWQGARMVMKFDGVATCPAAGQDLSSRAGFTARNGRLSSRS